MTRLCPNCGAPSAAFEAGGLVEVVHDAGIEGLRRLFTGELLAARCEVCSDPSDAEVSVVCVSDDPPAIDVLCGRMAQDWEPEAVIARGGVPVDRPYVVHPSADSLMHSVAARMKGRLAPINAAGTAIADHRLMDYLEDHWRQFPTETFAAAILPAIAPVPGTRVAAVRDPNAGQADAPTFEALLRYYGSMQAQVWLALCYSWMQDQTEGESLQLDLERYVLRGYVLPGALDAFDAYADNLETDELPFPGRYVLEATRAAAHLRADVPVGDGREWAMALATLEFACRRDTGTVPAGFGALRVAEEFARATVTRQDAWWAAQLLLATVMEDRVAEGSDAGAGPGRITGQEILTVQEVVEFLGFSGLDSVVNDVLAGYDAAPGFERLLEAVDAFHERGDDVDSALSFLKEMDAPLLRGGQADELERLADRLIEHFPSADARAATEIWLGSRLKLLRQPNRFLARVGSEPRPWESELGDLRRAALLTERSNALRLAGQPHAALEVARQARAALPDDAGDANKAVGDRNVGILLRETGAPDAALTIFTGLTTRGTAADRLEAFHSVAVTLAMLHRVPEAISALERALALADGPQAHRALSLRAALANLLAPGEPARAAALVREILDPATVLTDPGVVLPTAAALFILAGKASELVDQDQTDAIDRSLAEVRDRAIAAGDVPVACTAANATAVLHDVLGLADNQDRWLAADRLAGEFGQIPDAVVLLRLAAFAYEHDDSDGAGELLGKVPTALRRMYRDVRDLAAVSTGSEPLRYAAERLAAAALDSVLDRRSAPWSALRQVADLGRNAIGRTVARNSRSWSSDAPLPDDDRLAALAEPDRTIGVVEWIETVEVYVCMLTVITPDGQVRSRFLEAPDEDPVALAPFLPNLIRGWRRGRSGDPLEHKPWQALVAWWTRELSDDLTDGDHVVVIEHPDLVGLPWHAACGGAWTCSYTAGWFALLQDTQSRPVQRIGVVRVPKYGDAEEVRDALLTSTARTEAFANSSGLEFDAAEEAPADAAAVMSLLSTVDVAKLLCHGYQDPQTNEVGIVVADAGALPLRNSIAAATERGRRHRLDWSALQTMAQAPMVIFSLACLSGVVHWSGLGERLGLFTAFGPAGTRALIAPRWEVPPAEVAPILDAALEIWLSGDLDLARALHQACTAAAETLPPRYAWALMLEGDWR
ncbi:CHAT domain-containing protein [Kribbella pittospori]|uniref:CHAT domain-containing protein n=1 Tax=Kribbella pittospori TaxID=722689 RepID=A0A4R0KS63_9ACTN|nr:tetratricopeptide repeat protein [Kribbella pittospori]TCC63250.1 CHAT domain-containing protein [Kribbella pittospori]